MLKRNRPVNLLLVEDNPGDVRLTQEAFKEGSLTVNFSIVTDGVQALNFLYKRDRYIDAITPELILLDLNLPKVSGREVLKKIKEDEQLRRIPVVVLTTSEAEEDIALSYSLHANCYIKKPVDYSQFRTVIKQVEDFWLTTVILPTKVF